MGVVFFGWVGKEEGVGFRGGQGGWGRGDYHYLKFQLVKKVLSLKSDVYKSKYTFKPIMRQNMVKYIPLTNSGLSLERRKVVWVLPGVERQRSWWVLV